MKELHINELFIALLLNVRRLRGENIYWFTSAGFALRLQALNYYEGCTVNRVSYIICVDVCVCV